MGLVRLLLDVCIHVRGMDDVNHSYLRRCGESCPTSCFGWATLLIAYRLVRISVIKYFEKYPIRQMGTYCHDDRNMATPLDKAIYAGVVISIVGFQRTAN